MVIIIGKIKRFFGHRIVQSWLWLVAILCVWEFASRSGLVSSYLLPPFTKVAANIVRELFTGNLGLQSVNSLSVILYGFLLALAMGIVIVLLCSWMKPVENLFTTLSTVFNPLPAIALMPLIILWFGVSTGAMIAIIVHAVIWALVRHLLDGIRTFPAVYHEWSDNIQLSPIRRFTGVLIPAILPELIAGIRVGWGRTWRALIGAEMIFGMIGSLGGLGYYIHDARAYANITNVMSGVVVIVVIGIIFESVIFSGLEKYTVKKWGMMRG